MEWNRDNSRLELTRLNQDTGNGAMKRAECYDRWHYSLRMKTDIKGADDARRRDTWAADTPVTCHSHVIQVRRASGL